MIQKYIISPIIFIDWFDINFKESEKEISDYLNVEYKIIVFKGDIIDYLESLIYSLESIKNIGVRLANLDKNYLNEILEIPSIIEEIKYWPFFEVKV